MDYYNRTHQGGQRKGSDDLIMFAQTWPEMAQNKEVWKQKGQHFATFAQQWETQKAKNNNWCEAAIKT